MEVTNSCLTPCSLGFTPQMFRYAEKEIKSHYEYAFAVETYSKNNKNLKNKKNYNDDENKTCLYSLQNNELIV